MWAGLWIKYISGVITVSILPNTYLIYNGESALLEKYK